MQAIRRHQRTVTHANPILALFASFASFADKKDSRARRPLDAQTSASPVAPGAVVHVLRTCAESKTGNHARARFRSA